MQEQLVGIRFRMTFVIRKGEVKCQAADMPYKTIVVLGFLLAVTASRQHS